MQCTTPCTRNRPSEPAANIHTGRSRQLGRGLPLVSPSPARPGRILQRLQNTSGDLEDPTPDLLEAGLNPVSGAFVGVSQTLSGDISQGQSDIGHDISQREQHELKNRVIELETALSIERAHRTAAEQVGDIQRQRAETAESALRILESVIPRPAIEQSTTRNRTQDMPGETKTRTLRHQQSPQQGNHSGSDGSSARPVAKEFPSEAESQIREPYPSGSSTAHGQARDHRVRPCRELYEITL